MPGGPSGLRPRISFVQAFGLNVNEMLAHDLLVGAYRRNAVPAGHTYVYTFYERQRVKRTAGSGHD